MIMQVEALKTDLAHGTMFIKCYFPGEHSMSDVSIYWVGESKKRTSAARREASKLAVCYLLSCLIDT